MPAYDEGMVIARTLEAVLAQDHAGPLEVIVAANGCEDDTADIARSFEALAEEQGRVLRVLELPERGKIAALNAADATASGEVRVYVDADVTMSTGAVSALVESLEHEGTHLAALRMDIVVPRAPVVHGYVTVWSRLPYVLEGGAALAVFALSDAGRSRWDRFPEILADDSYARLQFHRSEVAMVEDATVTVRFPESLREMVAVRGRLFLGVWELHEKFPLLTVDGAPRGRVALETIARSPLLWLRAPSFFIVYLLGWLHARRALARHDLGWARWSPPGERSRSFGPRSPTGSARCCGHVARRGRRTPRHHVPALRHHGERPLLRPVRLVS